MKKILKSLSIVVGLPAIYIIINIITSTIYSIIYAISNGINLKKIDNTEMVSIVNSNSLDLCQYIGHKKSNFLGCISS